MDRIVRRFMAGLLLLAALAGPSATMAQSDDTQAIQTVIANQIAAFRSGDSDMAYSFASPGIQHMFPTPGVFMQMVEHGYEPVYRPRSFSFLEQRVGGDEAVQLVDVVGPDGSAWIAIYTLRKQSDGGWKITGCTLKPGVGA
jgi:ketosteroid isomerase-like protein